MIILIVIAVLVSEARAVTKICVLDSGISSESKVSMCYGVYDIDEIGHGTRVAKTIASYAGIGKYCFVSYKVFYKNSKKNNTVRALRNVINQCDVINMSIDSNDSFNLNEYMALWRASRSIKLFQSAGNSGQDLDKVPLFPVSYKLIDWTVVGNKHSTSNYGKVVNQIEDYCVGDFCGTSASVAIATGKYVKGLK